jgi:hypothetical protein
MIRYVIAMSIRLVCIGLVVVLPDLWKIAPAIGAIALPYIAVVIANNAGRIGGRVTRPGGLVRRTPEKDAA